VTTPNVAHKRQPVNTVHHVFAELQISIFGHDGEQQVWVWVSGAGNQRRTDDKNWNSKVEPGVVLEGRDFGVASMRKWEKILF